ncbi:MAG: hypothetical protein NC400_00940 [Clostridium sp.]|nr:hypothetical protein [Clostridium sp.]
MREIISVLGKIEGEKLGICQCHEHLMLRKGEGYRLNSDLCMDEMEKSVLEAEIYRRAGGSSLVDAQPTGCCRMERELREVARRTGVNIIASTGFHKRAFYPSGHWLYQKTGSELQAIFEAELAEGMYEGCDDVFSGKQTPIRAGIVKIALEDADEFQNGKARFTAAVRAAVHGEKSILVHTEPESPVLEFLDFAGKLGMKPERIAVCHMDRTKEDFALHLEVVRRGAFLEYDTIGRWKYHDNEAEAELIGKIVEEGFADRLLLSLDTTAARMKAYRKDAVGLDYILTEFLPFLEQRNFDRKTILNMLTSNSRYYLEAE